MYHEFVIVGRQKLENGKEHKLYRMRIFAKNAVSARNRFWYFLSRLRKVKRAAGEIVSFHEVFENKPQTIKNYGITLRFNSKYDTHNIYKEYRAMSRVEAVQKMYNEIASQQSVDRFNVQIISVARIAKKDLTSRNLLQFLHHNTRLPLLHRVLPLPKERRLTFAHKRPSTIL